MALARAEKKKTYAMASLPRRKRRSRLDNINEVLLSYAPGEVNNARVYNNINNAR
jgi:hypothetical protein